jgi:hypothetical protein
VILVHDALRKISTSMARIIVTIAFRAQEAADSMALL